MSRRCGLAKFLAGMGVGVGLGILFAPDKGDVTRAKIKTKCDELIEDLKAVDYNEVKDNMIDKIDNLKQELADLDKEKALEMAKIKAEEIKKQAEEIYKEAVKKGKPAIEQKAKELKQYTANFLQDIVDKLEEDNKTTTKKSTSK